MNHLYFKRLNLSRAFLITTAFLLLRCSNSSVLEDSSAKAHVTVVKTQKEPAGAPGSNNLASPETIGVRPYRIELLSDTNDQEAIVLESQDLLKAGSDGFVALEVDKNTQDVVQGLWGQKIPDVPKIVRYVKIYSSGIRLDFLITNLFDSGVVNRPEKMYLFFNDTSIGGLLFSSTRTGVYDYQSSRVLFVDTSQPVASALTATPATPQTINYPTSGQDQYGFYELVAVPEFNHRQGEALLVKITYFIGNLFYWTDVASTQGIFDGGSLDVFNWGVRSGHMNISVEKP